jgi:hypothetical protein
VGRLVSGGGDDFPMPAATQRSAPAPIFRIWHTVSVAWDVEFTGEFRDWWNTLSEEQQG